MAIRRVYNKKFKGLTLKSGHVYSFSYQAWRNDPKPVAILMYALEGIHENTGHQWRLLQMINFTYVPRSIRKRFIKEWMKVLDDSGGNVRFTWELIKRKYPEIQLGVRRYFTKPTYYIQDFKEVPSDEIDKVVVSTWSRDFSKKVRKHLLSTFRNVLRKNKKRK